MIIDWTRPVRVKGGITENDEVIAPCRVHVISTVGRGVKPVVGHIGESHGLHRWAIDGRYYMDGNPHVYDLENVPEEQVPALGVYVNIMRDVLTGAEYIAMRSSRHLADHDAGLLLAGVERIARVRIEWRPGQFDD